MLPLFLIIILSFYVFYCMKVMLKRKDDLHAMAFFVLYIYTIFAQIGYAYFPELSLLFGAYFGPNLFYKYWFFMFFSFVFTFLLYTKMNPLKSEKYYYSVTKTSQNYGVYFFFFFGWVLYITLNLYFLKYRDLFGYGGGETMGGAWFGIGFLILQTCTIIVYTLFRDKTNKINKRIFSLITFFLFSLFFTKVSIASGARSYLLSFFIAITFYELYPLINTIKFQKRKLFVFLAYGIILLSVLSILRNIRGLGTEISFSSIYNFDGSASNNSNEGLPSILLLQDYYLPSHTLFVSMKYKIIDPIEVLISNFTNSLVYFKYPFLTNIILMRGLDIDNPRGVGWAYHYFVEGYNAMGLFGVFYNAFFWNLFMALWIKLARSNNIRHNKAVLAVLSTIVLTTMKSQNSAFIRNYWLILLPTIVLIVLANNFKISFFKNRRLQ